MENEIPDTQYQWKLIENGDFFVPKRCLKTIIDKRHFPRFLALSLCIECKTKKGPAQPIYVTTPDRWNSLSSSSSWKLSTWPKVPLSLY